MPDHARRSRPRRRRCPAHRPRRSAGPASRRAPSRAGPAPGTPCSPALCANAGVPEQRRPADQAGDDQQRDAAPRALRVRRRAARAAAVTTATSTAAASTTDHRQAAGHRTAPPWHPVARPAAGDRPDPEPWPFRRRGPSSTARSSRSSKQVEILVVEQFGLGRRQRRRGVPGTVARADRAAARPRCASSGTAPQRCGLVRGPQCGRRRATPRTAIRLASGLVSSASRTCSRCGASRSMRIFSTPPCPSANTNWRGRVVGPVVVPRPRRQRAQHLLVADPGRHPQQPQRLGLGLARRRSGRRTPR